MDKLNGAHLYKIAELLILKRKEIILNKHKNESMDFKLIANCTEYKIILRAISDIKIKNKRKIKQIINGNKKDKIHPLHYYNNNKDEILKKIKNWLKKPLLIDIINKAMNSTTMYTKTTTKSFNFNKNNNQNKSIKSTSSSLYLSTTESRKNSRRNVIKNDDVYITKPTTDIKKYVQMNKMNEKIYLKLSQQQETYKLNDKSTKQNSTSQQQVTNTKNIKLFNKNKLFIDKNGNNLNEMSNTSLSPLSNTKSTTFNNEKQENELVDIDINENLMYVIFIYKLKNKKKLLTNLK